MALQSALKRQVISISLGMPLFFIGTGGGLGWAGDKAHDNGFIVVGAAGQVVSSVLYPGKYKPTIGGWS